MRLLKHLLPVLLLVVGSLALAGGGQQTGDAAAKKEREKIAQLKKAYEKAKATHIAKPKDQKVKKGFVDAATLYARTVMFAPSLAPKEKYPEALRVYREVLKADPKNREAKDSIQTIESIYTSMGRPIPK
ncbi:MAG: hypothetical protein N2109_11190 [Fimbriimonadales bacterium]|nr:hypothetical protein [Fimbriimonadales bacterium]